MTMMIIIIMTIIMMTIITRLAKIILATIETKIGKMITTAPHDMIVGPPRTPTTYKITTTIAIRVEVVAKTPRVPIATETNPRRGKMVLDKEANLVVEIIIGNLGTLRLTVRIFSRIVVRRHTAIPHTHSK